MGYPNYMTQNFSNQKWVRSSNGYLAGVCEGLGPALGIEPKWLRMIWLASVLIAGVGTLIYLLAWIALPRADDLAAQTEGRMLGVCVRLAASMNVDVGLVRFATLFLALSSLGLVTFVYIILHFFLKPANAAGRSSSPTTRG
jgi:phage shock protein C